jgi:APA family basic amino acid/polyamine antiporter
VLAGTLVLLLLAVFLTVNTAVLALRRDLTGATDHFRVPSVVPVPGALLCVALATHVEARVWALSAILLLVVSSSAP